MNKIDVRNVVLEIISDIAPDADITSIDDQASLKDQINLDSMDFLDLVMELRKRHKIEVPKEDYQRLNTMESCVSYLLPKFTQLAA